MTVRWVGHRPVAVSEASSPTGRLHVGTVGEDGDALAFADPDDAVVAGCGQIVGAAAGSVSRSTLSSLGARLASRLITAAA